MTAEGAPRPYRSARREQQAAETRALVLEAATSLFADRGWSGTAMREVAKQAGVSIETVYANFRSKTDLLLAAIDVGVVGDTSPAVLSQRPEFAAIGEGSRAERIAAAARMLTGINQRTWGLRRAINEGAVSEPPLAEKVQELEQRRRDNIQQGALLMLGEPVDDDVLDGLWVLMGADVFFLLTQVEGRPVADYEVWLAGAIGRWLGTP